MKNWRLTINRETKKATVELKQDVPWKLWAFMGVVESEEKAEELIRSGWPDHDGIPLFPPNTPFTLEVIR